MKDIRIAGRLYRTRMVILASFLALALGLLLVNVKPALADHDLGTYNDCESYLEARAVHPPSYWRELELRFPYIRDGGAACMYVEMVDSNGVPIPPNQDIDGNGVKDRTIRIDQDHYWAGRGSIGDMTTLVLPTVSQSILMPALLAMLH